MRYSKFLLRVSLLRVIVIASVHAEVSVWTLRCEMHSSIHENVIMHSSHHGSTCIHARVNGINTYHGVN